jgi:hypothetical protein
MVLTISGTSYHVGTASELRALLAYLAQQPRRIDTCA